MNFVESIHVISQELNNDDVHRIVEKEIEEKITAFRSEIRTAPNVETLLFLRRFVWDNLFSAEHGIYYPYCKQSPMLKTMRISADMRYHELLEQKRRNEMDQIQYVVVPTKKRILSSIVEAEAELDGELVENDICYPNKK
jgi:hypothetical protein